jgi:hypothetical protein
MTVPVVADRVMRARRETQCPACRAWIRPGQHIARCPGGLWLHASCFIGHRHNRDGQCHLPVSAAEILTRGQGSLADPVPHDGHDLEDE